jgi:uncharacterized protein
MSEELSAELERLDEFLLSDAVADDGMLLSQYDGLVAGLLVSPDLIMPGEWLPLVWGDQPPEFDTEDQAKDVIGLLMAHYNDVQDSLARDRYASILDVDFDDSPIWELWIEGFWQAVMLRPEAWLALGEDADDEVAGAMFGLSRLYEIASTPSAELEPLEVDEMLTATAADIIPFLVGTLDRARRARFRQAPRPKTGRNDPCPCGSGKKFKKCCLAA